ncbi:MAG: sporulation integral membrane protein YtvI [Clostridia bacterium]|nr:sporulation integral membrane protein YtvI [Clostridia bacterium]
MDKTQKRWSFIVNVLYLLIFVTAFVLFMKYAFWMVFPFIFALCIAALLQKPLKLLTKHKKSPKGLISALLSLLVFGAIIGVVALGGAKIVSGVMDFVTYFTDRCTSFADVFDVIKNAYLSLDIANQLPSVVNDYVTNGIDTIRDYFLSGQIVTTITDNISKIISPLSSVITTVPSFLASLLISVVATCFMTATFDDIKDFVLRQFSDMEKAKRAKQILVSSVGKMIKAYSIIICITTFELFIGLSLLKLIGFTDTSHILLISFLIALIDIVPVLGTGTVLVPWSIISFISGRIGMGIGLLVIYAVVTVIRQFMEPKLVAGQVGISPVVTIMAMYIGIKVFGAIGIFILPFIVIIVKLLNDEGIIHIFNSSPKHENSIQK